MASEYFDVGIELVEREHNHRQAAFVSRCDRPVVLKDLAKRPSVEQAGNRVIAGKIANAALGLEQGVVHLGAISRGRTGTAAPVCGVIANGLVAAQQQRLQNKQVFAAAEFDREAGFLAERTDSLTSSASSRPAISSMTSANGLPSHIIATDW